MIVGVVELPACSDDDPTRPAVPATRRRHGILVVVAPGSRRESPLTVLEHDAVATIREWSAAQHELDCALRFGGQLRHLDCADFRTGSRTTRVGRRGREEQRSDAGEDEKEERSPAHVQMPLHSRRLLLAAAGSSFAHVGTAKATIRKAVVCLGERAPTVQVPSRTALEVPCRTVGRLMWPCHGFRSNVADLRGAAVTPCADEMPMLRGGRTACRSLAVGPSRWHGTGTASSSMP